MTSLQASEGRADLYQGTFAEAEIAQVSTKSKVSLEAVPLA